MRFVVFGLSISSAWGNGHATLLRGLFRALYDRGHRVTFFEKDTPYYARHRDATEFPYVDLRLYREWSEIEDEARRSAKLADVGLVTSYCPDGVSACELVLTERLARTVFYDMDTPVTLERLARNETIEYLPANGLADFDLVLSYTGGQALTDLRKILGAKQVAPLYGWVDPAVHRRQPASADFAADLAYLGTYAPDRQPTLEALLFAPARQLPAKRFLIAGAMYPNGNSFPQNVKLLEHVAPPDHGRFYSSSPLMLSVTRESMARSGYCPSGRLFESAACGTAVLSDWWDGLHTFFTPGEEILIARSTADSFEALLYGRDYLERIGARARERTLDCHTAQLRAKSLVDLLESSRSPADEALAGGRA